MNENVDPARVEARPQFPPPSTPSRVSPNDAPTSPPGAPTPPKTPPRTRRLAKWLFVLAIAIATYFAWQHFEDIAPNPEVATAPAPKPGRGGGGANGPQTIRDAEATTGDVPLYVDALGTVT